jgi:hypothetical protein
LIGGGLHAVAERSYIIEDRIEIAIELLLRTPKRQFFIKRLPGSEIALKRGNRLAPLPRSERSIFVQQILETARFSPVRSSFLRARSGVFLRYYMIIPRWPVRIIQMEARIL